MMIQELLRGSSGGGVLGSEERNFPIKYGVFEGSPLHATTNTNGSSTPTTAAATAASTTATTDQQQPHLRCPRCDSSNTKFCYYNNYNLTQPRHFCKTCRRYWTKGGALRNVPIGGGCRKNKSSIVTTSTPTGKAGGAGKMKTGLSEFIKSSSNTTLGFGFDHHQPAVLPASAGSTTNPILWASPQNSHLLALLRAAQNPNPNPAVKEEENMIGSHMVPNHHSTVNVTGGLNARSSLNLDDHPMNNNHGRSSSFCSPFWRNINQNHQQQQQQQQQQHQSLLVGRHEVDQNTSGNVQELYQTLRSASAADNYYSDDQYSSVVIPMGGSTSTAPTTCLSILEPSSGAVSSTGTGNHHHHQQQQQQQLGYWNHATAPSFPWSNLPATTATNGAFLFN